METTVLVWLVVAVEVVRGVGKRRHEHAADICGVGKADK